MIPRTPGMAATGHGELKSVEVREAGRLTTPPCTFTNRTGPPFTRYCRSTVKSFAATSRPYSQPEDQ